MMHLIEVRSLTETFKYMGVLGTTAEVDDNYANARTNGPRRSNG